MIDDFEDGYKLTIRDKITGDIISETDDWVDADLMISILLRHLNDEFIEYSIKSMLEEEG
jgi:hypothetical protein